MLTLKKKLCEMNEEHREKHNSIFTREKEIIDVDERNSTATVVVSREIKNKQSNGCTKIQRCHPQKRLERTRCTTTQMLIEFCRTWMLLIFANGADWLQTVSVYCKLVEHSDCNEPFISVRRWHHFKVSIRVVHSKSFTLSVLEWWVGKYSNDGILSMRCYKRY